LDAKALEGRGPDFKIAGFSADDACMDDPIFI
jgi:hypothetical protein